MMSAPVWGEKQEAEEGHQLWAHLLRDEDHGGKKATRKRHSWWVTYIRLSVLALYTV